jgi:hypothetical protein
LAIFFLCQAVSADIIPNSADGIFSPKTEGTKTAARVFREMEVEEPLSRFLLLAGKIFKSDQVLERSLLRVLK